MENVKTKRIKFTQDVIVDIRHVGKSHIGAIAHRPADGSDPLVQVGVMQHYYPKGREITIPDYIGSGAAVEIEQTMDVRFEEIETKSDE